MKIIKKILFAIVLIILIPLIIYNVVIFYKNMNHPNEIPDFLGYKTFIILSGSMKPKFNINDMVVIKEVSEEEIKKNDVIAFNISGKNITHRIIDIKEINEKKHYVTKGDFNNTADKYDITYDNIEGKVVSVIPKVGGIFKLFQSKKVIFVFMIFAFSICFLNCTRN